MIRSKDGLARAVVIAAVCGCSAATSSAPSPAEPAPTRAAAVESEASPPPDPAAPDEAPPASAEPPAASSSGTTPAVPARPRSRTERLMGEHYRAAETLRQAIIFGDRDEIFKPSRKLVYLSNVDELPPDWRAPVERMQRSAERLKDSTDMPTAAAAMADVGTSCGWCHERLGGPRVKLGAPPASDGSLHARMKRHAWAVERLWEGLYVPSSEAWSTGLAALSHEPFAANVLHDRGVYARSAADDFEKALTAAPGSDDPSKQAATYARLLTTCATCHLAEP